jgi:hypothetical protein
LLTPASVKNVASAGWGEALGVELGGDGTPVQSCPMKLLQPFDETLVVFQVLELVDRTSQLMLRR